MDDPLLDTRLVGVEPPRRQRRKRFHDVRQAYHARTPQPNYSEFGKAEFVDAHGRHYKIPPTDEQVLRLLAGTDPRTTSTRILWIRLPIRKGGSHMESPRQGDRLRLYQLRSQREATCLVEQNFMGPRAATGYLRVTSFVVSVNPSVNPSEWKPQLPGQGPRKTGLLP